MQKRFYIWAMLRIALGLIFLWAFIDKVFGLGFSTARDAAWIHGGSPTTGFLLYATKGPFASFFQSLAGNTLIDWLFMIGLLVIGLALITGIFVKLASATGALMLLFMWLAVLPPEHHPFLDDHLIYLLVLIGFIVVHAGKHLGFGTWWTHHKLVKKYPILE